MQTSEQLAMSSVIVLIGGALLALSLGWPLNCTAQDKSKHIHQADAPTQQKDKQSYGEQKHMSKMGSPKHEMGAMGGPKPSAWWFEDYNRGRKQGMPGMKEMPADKTDADSMTMPGSSAGGHVMNDDVDMMGMRPAVKDLMGMGATAGAESASMKRMSEMKRASSQPGVPGISHFYHVGATGHFLDHAEHIALMTKQQAMLNVIKQKALLNKATAQRKIDEAEQQLWELTGMDEPDLVLIQTKVESIEKLRGEQRMAIIRSVAEGAKVLTEEQREVLLGLKETRAAQDDVPSEK